MKKPKKKPTKTLKASTVKNATPYADKVFLIEESNRPGEMMPIMEDEHGTYIMNSKDLRGIEVVAKLAKIGVDSLKVEAVPSRFIMLHAWPSPTAKRLMMPLQAVRLITAC